MSLILYLYLTTDEQTGNMFPWPVIVIYLLDFPAYQVMGRLYHALFGSYMGWTYHILVITLSSVLYGFAAAWLYFLLSRLRAFRR